MRLLLSVDSAYGNPPSDIRTCVDFAATIYHPVFHASASGEWLLEVKRSGCVVLRAIKKASRVRTESLGLISSRPGEKAIDQIYDYTPKQKPDNG